MTDLESIIALCTSEGISLDISRRANIWQVSTQRVVERELSAFYRCAIGRGQSLDLPDAISLARSACLLDLESYTVRCATPPATNNTSPTDLLSLLNLRPKPLFTGPIRRA